MQGFEILSAIQIYSEMYHRCIIKLRNLESIKKSVMYSETKRFIIHKDNNKIKTLIIILEIKFQ